MQASSPITTTTTTTSTTATTPTIHYVCSHCNAVLKTNHPEAIVEQSAINEDCPTCGYPLSQYVTQVRVRRSSSSYAPLKPAEFSLASDCGKLTFGIAELDNRFALWTGEGSCIHGPAAGMLIERLCARALMPAKAGGLGSERVVFVDGGNSSDVYRFVEYARLFGLDYRDALRRIVQSRAFTVYQLVDLVTNHLAGVVEETGAKAVFVSDLFEMFEREPNLDEDEGRRLASKMTEALAKMMASSSSSPSSQRHLVVVSLSRRSRYDESLARFGKHLFVEENRLAGFATLRLQDRFTNAALRVAALV